MLLQGDGPFLLGPTPSLPRGVARPIVEVYVFCVIAVVSRLQYVPDGKDRWKEQQTEPTTTSCWQSSLSSSKTSGLSFVSMAQQRILEYRSLCHKKTPARSQARTKWSLTLITIPAIYTFTYEVHLIFSGTSSIQLMLVMVEETSMKHKKETNTVCMGLKE